MSNLKTILVRNYLAVIILFLSAQLVAQTTDHLTATIIGSGSPKYSVKRAGPSVLISYKNTHILVDMGNGTQANLNKHNTKIRELDGLLFTHHHLDHNEEFTPIFIQSLLGRNKVQIAGPKPTTSMVDHILEDYREDIDYRLSKSGRNLKSAITNITFKDLKGDESFYIGDIKISCTPVNHTITTLAYRFDVGDESIVISGDLTYSKSLSTLAKNADYLLMDSGGVIELGKTKKPVNKRKQNTGNNKHKAHVNLEESSQMAAEANVKNLVLTHFNFTNIDEEASNAEIQKNYTGTIVFATDLMTLSNDQKTHSHNSKSDNHDIISQEVKENPCNEKLAFTNEVSITKDTFTNTRIISSNSIPNHTVGQFPTSGNPNKIVEQQKTYNVSLSPELATKKTYVYDLGIDKGTPSYVFGVAINGVKFEPSANEFFRNTKTNEPNYEWTLEPLSNEVNLGEDCNNAHVQPNGEYHYHGTPTGLITHFNEDKMNLVGWAADGFPMYYKMGYKNPMDANSGTIELKSSYVLKKGERPGDGISAPNGQYSGKFVADYTFQENYGDLDECNGRTGVTPEFPEGTYYYVVSNDFPSASRCFMGTPSKDFKIGGGKKQPKTGRQQRSNSASDTLPTFEKMLERMDKNKDHKISRAEAKGNLKNNFDRRDTNQDGYITEDEMTRRRKQD